MLQKMKSLIVSYGHMTLPLLYGLFYVPIFSYLEKRPVEHINIIEMKIDAYIPFCEYFIIPYLVWFAYIGISVITFMFLDRKDYYKLCTALGAGMTVFLFISYIWPNGLQLRPDVYPRDNFCTDLVRILQAKDTSTNVFPSIHCFKSMVVNAAIWKNAVLEKKKGIKWGSCILCILILLSTLFLKQHSVMDLVAAFFMFVALYIPLYAIPEWQEKKQDKKIVSGKLS